MSILRDLIKQVNENAAGGAVGAGAVGSVFGSLFGGGVVSRPKARNRNLVNITRLAANNLSKSVKNRNSWKWKILGEMVDNQQFDMSDVMSKLDSAEKKAKQGSDTIPFGMEDEDGNIVKVYVKADEADEFEAALAAMLAGEHSDDPDDITDSVEIAEVLFQLKDRFSIVDVEWPKIEGDEEEEQDLKGAKDDNIDMEANKKLPGEDGSAEAEGAEGNEPPGDLEDLENEVGNGEDALGDINAGAGGMEPEGGVESALQQVIDMMKADAEARKAESEARAKEAEARAAEANAQAAASKVKQEEDVLDMESYNSKKKEEDDESQRLAKLAKYRHDLASRAETKLASREEEEQMFNVQDHYKPVSKDQLMRQILNYLQRDE